MDEDRWKHNRIACPRIQLWKNIDGFWFVKQMPPDCRFKLEHLVITNEAEINMKKLIDYSLNGLKKG